MLHRTDQPMLDHLSIARKDVVTVQRAQELAIDKDTGGYIERTHLILQAVEVDSRLTAHSRIHRSHQGRRDVDVADASLEGSSGKASHIGHHTATQIHQQRVARSPFVGEAHPDGGQLLDILMRITCLYRNDGSPLKNRNILHQRITFLQGVPVCQDKELVIV